MVRPFDIEERNKFFAKTNYSSKEVNMFTEIGRLYNIDSQSPMQRSINKKALELNNIVNSYASKSAQVINSKEMDAAVEAKMIWCHENFPALMRNTHSLQKYEEHMMQDSSFW
jgi:hypothetical protein